MKPLPFKDLSGRIVLPSPGAWVNHGPEDWPHEPVPQEELDAIGYVPEGEEAPETQLTFPENVVDYNADEPEDDPEGGDED